MKKAIKNLVVVFSLVFTLVLTAGITTITNTTEDTNPGISTLSDRDYDHAVTY